MAKSNTVITKSQNENNSILKIFKNEFSSTVNVVHINSLNQDLKFREVSVSEQKSFSKIMIENENRKDIIYDAQCALINTLCLDKLEETRNDPITGETKTILVPFDVYKLTEFDRIRLMIEVYQSNYFKNDITFKCAECGAENTYKLDFDQVSKKLDAFTLEDTTFYMEDKNHKYCFTLNYPSVKRISDFYKLHSKKYKTTFTPKQREVLDNIGNVDYINLFIKSIEITNKITGEVNTANLFSLSCSDVEELISYLPQNIVFDETRGVMKYISTEFIGKINDAFNYEKCFSCGADAKHSVGGISDFL